MDMATASVVPGVWLIMMLAGGVGSLPLGGAPLPPDPVMSAIAPQECLWYAAYSGQGEADPESTNQTEQLFAEPEIKRFTEEIESQVMKALRRTGRNNREQAVVVDSMTTLVRTALTRPLAVYVEDAGPSPDGGVMIEAAFVMNAGEQRADAQRAIGALLDLAKQENKDELQLSEESLAGLTWTRPALPPQAPPVRWAWKDDYLLVAVGDATPQRLVDRMNGSAPQWLTDLRAKHAEVTREISVARVDVAGILSRVQPLVEQNEPQAWPIVERLGLTSVTAITARSGFDEVGCVNEAHIATDGQRRGLLAFLPHEPLSKRDLSCIPRDALVAGAVRLDPSEVWDNAVDLARQFDPRAEDEFDDALRQIAAQLGIDVRRDVVNALDDVWVAYLPGGDLMSSWLNGAVAVKVKDQAALERAITKLTAIARMQMRPDEAVINESPLGDGTMYTLQVLEDPIPFSPSWCVSDGWLVAGLLPQAVRTAVERPEGESLAEADAVDDAVFNGAAALGYQDTPRLVRSVYPWLQMGAQMLSGQLRREGIEIDPSILPTVDTIVRHLRPGVGAWSHDSDGFHVISRGSLPGGGNMVAAVPVVTALGLPAIAGARTAARETQDMNSMRQILLGMLNYESANRSYPSDIVDENGKPLLSWRVAILPYLEEQTIYDRLHLDEPWDSPHNSELLREAPRVYQSADGSAPAGKTRFMALAGPGTLYEDGKGLQLRQITDGTSNTVCVVRADAAAAIEWAKPGDLPYDPENPSRGLTGGGKNALVGMCDGSVHRLSPDFDLDTLRAIATYAGGEVVNFWEEIRR
ncbi:MAG: hypothetical protein CMJ58_17485 [Planctomycetaceae bacterium]|nr:hypothetical protein [Planctomycetaceae bacterium]